MFDAAPNNGVDKLDRVRAMPPLPDNPDAALPGTEDEIALEFANRYAGELRYVDAWHRWLQWAGSHWRRIEDLLVFHRVRLVAREFAKLHNDKKLGKDAATAAIERIARNDRRHDTPSDAWDPDPELFGTSDTEEAP
jgi:putative DNA primase/helicase